MYLHWIGDVSSLNAHGGSSTLHSSLWPRLTTLSLVLLHYGLLQQLLQLFFGQKTTINEKISNCLAFNEKIMPTKNNENGNNKNSDKRNNGQHPAVRAQDEMTKVCRTSTKQHPDQHTFKRRGEHVPLQQRNFILSGTISIEVATNCYKNVAAAEENEKEQTMKMQLLKDTFFQINLINNKNEQLPRTTATNDYYHRQQQHDNLNNITQEQLKQHAKNCYQHPEELQQHPVKLYEQHMLSNAYEHQQFRHQHQQHQVACDKILYEDYNLTMAALQQVANIFNVATIAAATANIVRYHSPVCHKQSVAINHNLCVQHQQQQHQEQCCSPLPLLETTNPTNSTVLSLAFLSFYRSKTNFLALEMATTAAAASRLVGTSDFVGGGNIRRSNNMTLFNAYVK